MKIKTTIGDVWLAADNSGLTAVSFQPIAEGQQANQEILLLGKNQGTIFQKKVWQALQAIPFGEIRTYKEIAIAVGSPKAVRAIGQANRTNPLPIVIPCHRVIGQNGQLTGYMGNTEEGIAIKRQLLVLEGYFSENEEGVSK